MVCSKNRVDHLKVKKKKKCLHISQLMSTSACYIKTPPTEPATMCELIFSCHPTKCQDYSALR
jgi:hypothetical protein